MDDTGFFEFLKNQNEKQNTSPDIIKDKEIEYKENSARYVEELQRILGKQIVIKNPAKTHSVLFPISWLKMLGDNAIKELSDELCVSQEKLRAGL